MILLGPNKDGTEEDFTQEQLDKIHLKVGLLFLSMLFLLGCQSKEVRYIPYYNERFGFGLVYPSFMTKDPSPENGDGISCRGQGLELNAYGGMDLTWMDLDDTGLGTRDLYPEDEVFYEQRVVDFTGIVHCKKLGRFPGTDNGDVILMLELGYPKGKIDQRVVDSILGSFRMASLE
ncbi:MAG: hypothetical protein IKT08_08530 [Bacteroidales bacterium]|nr:hypothetical protein [Bacteroidales bacterium]